MKKIVKIPLYTIGAVGLYAIAGFYGVPYIITKIAPVKFKELSKSEICQIQQTTFNPFTFELNLHQIKLTTPTNTKLLEIKNIHLKVDLVSTIKEKKIYIENIAINDPSIVIEKYNNGEFNFNYLLLLSKNDEKEKSNEPVKLHIDSFSISNGEFSFDDQNKNAQLFVDTQRLNFSLLNLDTTPNFTKETKINLTSDIKTSGLVDFQSKLSIALNGSFDKKDMQDFKFNINNFVLNIKNIGYEENTPKRPFIVNIEEVQLQSRGFNSTLDTPLSAYFLLNNLIIKEQKNSKKIFNLDNITTNIQELNLKEKNIHIGKVVLLNPSFNVRRVSSGNIDLIDFIPRSKKKKEKSSDTKSSTTWSYLIDNISLENGNFGITDEVPNPKVTLNLEKFNFGITGFSSDPTKNINLALDTTLNQKSKIDLKTDLKLSTMQANGEFNLAKIDLPLFNPYIKDFTHIKPVRGKISTSGKFDFANKLAKVDGKIALDDWIINDDRDDSVLFGWNKIGVTPFVFDQQNNALKIKQLNIDGLYTNVKLDKAKVLNFSGLSKNQENNTTNTQTTKNESKKDFYFELQKLYIQKSSANFNDESLPLPFKTYINNLNGTINNISTKTDINASIALKGNVDDIGTANIDGKVYVANPKDFAKVKVVFENLELKQYTPYSMEFLGYEIDDGRLFLNLDYALNNKMLQSSNLVSINQIKLGKEKAGGSPWPLGLVVAILEDSDGMIELDLPIEGNVDSPDFKYGKVVWKTIGNVFTKVVTSPFRMFSSMLGIEDNSIEDIEFLYGDSTILPSEIKKLDSIATILSKRKKLQLSVATKYDIINDKKALQIKQLLQKASKVKSAEMEFNSLDGVTLEIAENLANKSFKDLDKTKEEFHTKSSDTKEFEQNYFSYLIDKLIHNEEVKEETLINLAKSRAKAISNYLNTTYKINDILIEKEETAKEQDNKEITNKIKSKLGLVQKK